MGFETWNNGLSMANEKVNADEKTFLNVIFVFVDALTTNGPWGFGGAHVPVNGIT